MLGKLFNTADEILHRAPVKGNYLPPDITHENKAVMGKKDGDPRLQVRLEAHSYDLCFGLLLAPQMT